MELLSKNIFVILLKNYQRIKQNLKVLIHFNKLLGYDHFEILSELLKKTKFIYNIPKMDKEVNNIKDNVCELSEWVEKSKRLYDK